MNNLLKGKERYEYIKKCVEQGATQDELGLELGISGSRVGQIIRRTDDYVKIPTHLHKIFTKDKRASLGLPKDKVLGVNNGIEHIHELARMRDNHTCKDCGKVWEIGKRRFDIHHDDPKLDGRARLLTSKENYENFDKLVTLCHKCHFNRPETKERISKKLSPMRLK